MTPKLRAEALVKQYSPFVAKAIVTEIIKTLESFMPSITLEYYREVLKEIEK